MKNKSSVLFLNRSRTVSQPGHLGEKNPRLIEYNLFKCILTVHFFMNVRTTVAKLHDS